MESDLRNYVNCNDDITEIVGDYMPEKRLDERTIIEFCQEFGLKEGVKFSMIGYREDWLFFCNYIVECFSKTVTIRPMRNKEYEPRLLIREIMGEYKLRQKFNDVTIEKIDKDFVLVEEDLIEISGLPEEWLLLVNFILERYSF